MDHLDGAVCWCNPILLGLCPECTGKESKSCAACNDSGVIRAEDGENAMILHIEFEDEEGGAH